MQVAALSHQTSLNFGVDSRSAFIDSPIAVPPVGEVYLTRLRIHSNRRPQVAIIV